MNQWTWIWERAIYITNECYNQYYDDNLNLVTTDESSSSSELEAESHNDSVPHEMFFQNKKTFWYFSKNYQILLMSSLFANSAIILSRYWKIMTNQLVWLAFFLSKWETVCQNEKRLKSKINSSVNMSNKIGQCFEINYLKRAW